MKHFAGRAILAVSMALVCAPEVLAGPITISNVTGTWQNANPAAAATYANAAGSLEDFVHWGGTGSAANDSGYRFDPIDGSLNPTLATPFALGTFTHQNQTIFGTPISSVQYAFGFSTNGDPIALNDIFNFSHNETPNTPGTCVYASLTPCADAVVVSSVNLNSLIDVGGDLYFFNLLGFSTNGGATISSQFISQEGGNNSAVLYGMVTSRPVPDGGATMLMLGACMVGIATLRNKFRV